MNQIKQLNIKEPAVLSVICQMAKLLKRKPHDAARRFILEDGASKVAQLKAESQVNS